MAKKVIKEECITDAIWRNISKISPSERVIMEIFGQFSLIMEAFSKGEKNKFTLLYMTKKSKKWLYYERIWRNISKFNPPKFNFWNIRSNCAYNEDVFQRSKNTTTKNIIPYNSGEKIKKRGLHHRRNLKKNLKKNTF